MIDNLELLFLTIAMVLIFIGIIKIHLNLKSRSSFIMFWAAILLLISGAIYFGTWIMVTFYYGLDNSPKFLSYILFVSELVTDLIFLMGAIGFYGLSKSYAKAG